MYYSSNHLFHFTKFESAIKIIASSSLRFGKFKDMNDIAEVKRDVFGMIDYHRILKELGEYQSISLTLDKASNRGFFIDPLWGHYAEKGNGVCLVFDKRKLIYQLKKQFRKTSKNKKIKYPKQFNNAIFPEGNTLNEVSQWIESNIDNIFFTKSKEWKYEQEYRLLVKGNTDDKKLQFADALIAAIICFPYANEYKAIPEFKILKALLKGIPILHYTTSFGDKELVDENGNQVDSDRSKWESAL